MNTLQTHRDSDFQTRKRAERIESMAKEGHRFVKLFKRVYSGKASPRQAIRAHCLDCVCFDIDAIRNCTAPACPLYGYRPYAKRRVK